MDTFAWQSSTEKHEGWHFSGAALTGCRISDATVIRAGRAAGSILIPAEDGSTEARLMILHAPRQALRKYELDNSGCAGDVAQAWALADAATSSEAESSELFYRTEGEAWRFVHDPEAEHLADWIGRALLERRRLKGPEIGAEIAAARKEYAARNGVPYRWVSPDEEQHMRAETLRRMGVAPVRGTPRSAPRRKPSRSPEVAELARQCEILGKQRAAKRRKAASLNPEHKLRAR